MNDVNNIAKSLNLNDYPSCYVDENGFEKVLKYEVDQDKLDEYYEDLLLLEDWIPFEIIHCMSLEFAREFGRGEKVKNKQLREERIREHELAYRGLDVVDRYNGEIESFIRKYPHFKSIFIEI